MAHHHHDHDAGAEGHEHDHDHDAGHRHGHTHGIVDPSIASSDRGLWALKWSFIGLMATAVIQTAVVILSGSAALLADTVHNFGDAATAIPLGVAFWLARRGATPRFTYGLGRVEDLAGRRASPRLSPAPSLPATLPSIASCTLSPWRCCGRSWWRR